jgi:sugar diacid utilization regulator
VTVTGNDPLDRLLAAADPDAVSEFVQTALAGLAAATPARRRVLLDTFATARTADSQKAAAHRIRLSPRHLRQRLQRVEDLTSLNLNHPVERSLLDLAVEAIPFLRRG